MSGTLEESLSVRWKVRLENRFSTSRKFYAGLNKVVFVCEDRNGDIDLSIHRYEHHLFDSYLKISVRVKGTSNGRALDEITEVLHDHADCDEILCNAGEVSIWHRKISDIEAAVPLFRSKRELTFLVKFGETDSVTDDETSESASLRAGQVISSDKNPVLCLESLAEDFAKLLDASSNPDVELHCEGHTTRAHKSILCTRSPVLASMLQSDMIEGRTGVANIRDMTNDTLQQFLRYLYTGKLDTLTFDATMRLYEAGDMFGVKRLASRCSGFLISGLTVENACDTLVVADAHSDSKFKEAVIAFMLAKKVPMSGDNWRDFCKSHPILGIEVYGRFCEMVCKEKS